ncbi:MAG: DUF2169 domain-containing protein [Telluria sp.]
MEFENRTLFPALHFDAIDQHESLFHVVVMRQTYKLTPGGLVRSDEQNPIRDTDVYFADDVSKGVRQESDLCPFKPRCDIVVNATAYAPAGLPVRAFEIRLVVEGASSETATTRSLRASSTSQSVDGREGSAAANLPQEVLIDKRLVVTGERHFKRRGLFERACGALIAFTTLGAVRPTFWRLTRPAAFTSMALRYDQAYGGQCRIYAQEAERRTVTRKLGPEHCLSAQQLAAHPEAGCASHAELVAHSASEQNPLGKGFATKWYLKASRAHAIPAPRVELRGSPLASSSLTAVRSDATESQVAGLSMIGRAWLPRIALAGPMTFPDHWAENDIPSLGSQFDHGYWNGAPRNQQCRHLHGDEYFTLTNLSTPLTPDARRKNSPATVLRFQLPGIVPFLALTDESGRIGAKLCVLDTVYVEPDAGTVELVWRAAVPAEAGIAGAELRVATSEEDAWGLLAVLAEQENAAAPDSANKELENAA